MVIFPYLLTGGSRRNSTTDFLASAFQRMAVAGIILPKLTNRNSRVGHITFLQLIIGFNKKKTMSFLQTCWFNSGSHLSIFLLRQRGATLDEIPEDDSFMGIFKSWYTLAAPEQRESRPALARFIQEFLANDVAIFDRTQESRLFFFGLAPNPATNSFGVPLFDYVQPTTITFVNKDRCPQCQDPGYVRPGNLATNVAFDIHLPLAIDRDPNESLQSLVDDFFNVQQRGELADCSNPQCSSQVNVATYIRVVDGKEAVIINIDRFLPTPGNDVRGITGKPQTA